MTENKDMNLSLGPVLFDWSRDELLKFYDEAADYPVAIVYLGEVVCPKMAGLTISDLETVGKKLEAAGKKVFISSLALVADKLDKERTRQIMDLPFAIECNDPAALQLGKGKELAAGPHINSYNIPTVNFLKKEAGISRLVFPVELSTSSIKTVADECDIETEAFAYGNLPIAFSWRCYTSRAFGLLKSNCKHDCRKFPDGMLIEDLDHKPLFKLNGTQVLSGKCSNLIREVDDLKDAGVNTLRISPQHNITKEVVDIFHRRIAGDIDADEAMKLLTPLEKIGFCNGWAYDQAGLEYLEDGEAASGIVIE
ncbi:MAG: U32 family peptidase [bacterium]|nr:U32 family peptidase [bacterium]